MCACGFLITNRKLTASRVDQFDAGQRPLSLDPDIEDEFAERIGTVPPVR